MRAFKVTAQLATYIVRFKKKIVSDGTECDGLADFENKTLWIKSGLSVDCTMTTICHEFLHAIMSELDRDDLTYNEVFIETLSQNIAKFVRALPKELK